MNKRSQYKLQRLLGLSVVLMILVFTGFAYSNGGNAPNNTNIGQTPSNKEPATEDKPSSGSPSSARDDMNLVSQKSSSERKVLQDADTVDDLLNEFWTQELQAKYRIKFDPPNSYEYYRGEDNPPCGGFEGKNNAYYCDEESDEYVAFDLDWFNSYLAEHPGGATTFLILAHEWGHAVQDTWVEQQPNRDSWNPKYKKELNADCLAGVWMDDALRRGTVIEENGDGPAIFLWLWEGGSGPWFKPGTHGTKKERQEAFSDGFNEGTDYCRRHY